jgi:SWI/SNF-related matrix-associated actin-dependent regulator of chromatin subfamily A member 5
MKPYQISGLSYMVWLYRNGASGILGDEMGLGKTLQTLSLFSYLTTYEPCPEGHHRPFLVICPLSVLSSWMSECKRWTPHLRALRFHGPSIERARLKKVAETGELFGVNDNEGEGRGYDVVVTSYEVFEREKAWFRRAFVWRYVVLDEGHKIKNEKANVSIALQGLAAEYRLILTGTPLQNNMAELWALLHWLYPDVFIENTQKRFSDAFNLSLGKNDINALDNARRLLELVMLRRMKESQGVNLGLPKKTELVMFLPLAPMQRFWYKRLLTRLDKGLLEGVFKNSKDRVEEDMEEIGKIDVGEHVVEEELNNIDEDQWGATRQIVEKTIEENTKDGGKWRKLMNLMMQLRKVCLWLFKDFALVLTNLQCCNHPYLLPHAEPGDDDLESHNSMMILASSKMIFLDKLVEELCMRQGKKVLIFTGFTRMLDVCEDFMHLKGGDGTRFKFGRLDGTTPRARRNLAIRLFNTDPCEYKSTRLLTILGIEMLMDLSLQSYVDLYARWWTRNQPG